MAAPPSAPPALRPLLEVGGALLRQSSTGRLMLGRAAGLLPPGELDAALARARADASTPLRAKEVEKVLRDAWGRSPARVLGDLDVAAPVAVSPLAQVHRGELDGAPVAVKVRRPGLDAAVRADLALLDALRPALAAAFSRLDGAALVAFIRERALDEVDLEHEAEQQRAAGRALRATEGVAVPATHLELAAPAVLVSGWLEGATLDDARPRAPASAARVLLAAHLAAARAGLILYDPRPNHVVLRPDGVGLLGAGAAVAIDRGRIERFVALLAALRDADADRFAAALRTLDLLDDGAEAAFAWVEEVLGPFAQGPARLDPRALAALAGRALERVDTAAGLAAAASPAPADLWLARGLGQLVATLARLEPTEDWVATASRGA